MGHKSLEEIAAAWNVTPVEAYMRMVKATSAEVDSGQPMEDVIVTSMSEDDVRWFIARPEIMFCSDGDLHGAHPRGAGRSRASSAAMHVSSRCCRSRPRSTR